MKYKQGVVFDKIIKIYEFDREIRALLFEIIEEIEIRIKTQIASIFAEKYGAMGYLDKNNFNDKHNKEKFDEKIKKSKVEHKKTYVIKHYEEKYEGCIPIWVIMNFFTTGMLDYFYADMKLTDKKKIAKQNNYKTEQSLMSWLRCLRDIRNRIVHFDRLYYWNFINQPSLRIEINNNADRALFTQIITLMLLYCSEDKWNNTYLVRLEQLIEKYEKYIDLQHIGFPENYKKILTKTKL